MASDGLDADEVEADFRAILDANPRALATGITPHGFFAPLPEALLDEGRPILNARSALDVVAPSDRERVIEAWHETLNGGRAHIDVHLLHNGEAELYLFDLRPAYGILAGILVPDGDVEFDPVVDVVDVRPRVCYQEKSENALFIDVDEATTKMLGWSREDFIGHGSLEFVHPDDHERAIESWMDMLSNPGTQRRTRLRYRHADGSWVWVELTNYNHFDDPDRARVVTELLDVSDEMAVHEELRHQERLLRCVAETVPLGIAHLDGSGEIVYANERFYRILDVAKGDPDPFHAFGDEETTLRTALNGLLGDGTDRDIELTVRSRRRADDRRCLLRLRSVSGIEDAVEGAIVCVEDITERAKTHAELHRRATFDPLTGCLNRASVLQTIAAQLERGYQVGVIYIDLDGFKHVNDTYGHHAGDTLLVEVAHRVQNQIRAADTIGRLGGDEFVVVGHGQDRESLEALAARITQAIDAPIHLERTTVTIRASMGIATTHGGASSCDQLVAEADTAMYAAKRDARRREAC